VSSSKSSVSLAALIELLAMNTGSVCNLPRFVDVSVKNPEITGTHNFGFKPLFLGNIYNSAGQFWYQMKGLRSDVKNELSQKPVTGFSRLHDTIVNE